MREEKKGGGEAKRNDVAFDVLETPVPPSPCMVAATAFPAVGFVSVFSSSSFRRSCDTGIEPAVRGATTQIS